MAQQAAIAGLGMQMGGVGGVGRFNLGLGSPGLVGMPGSLNMAQLAQLNAAGMNPFNMNMIAWRISARLAYRQRHSASRRVWTTGSRGPWWY